MSDNNEDGAPVTSAVSTQKQGEVKTYDITIKNSTSVGKEFNINIYDFDMNGKGKSSFLPPGKGKYSLAKWVNLSPTFVSLIFCMFHAFL